VQQHSLPRHDDGSQVLSSDFRKVFSAGKVILIPCSIASDEAFYSRRIRNGTKEIFAAYLSSRDDDIFTPVHDGYCPVGMHDSKITGMKATTSKGLLCCFWITEVL